MALKINQSATFLWPVTVHLPTDGGKFDKQTFDVEFARLKVSEADAMVAGIVSGATTPLEGYRQLVKGWRGVLADGQEVPFSDDTLQQVLEIPTVGPAILEAFKEAISGAARAKN